MNCVAIEIQCLLRSNQPMSEKIISLLHELYHLNDSQADETLTETRAINMYNGLD